MRERVSTYTGSSVEITYDRTLCIHAAECGRGSHALFDASKDPWCEPDAVQADEALAIVARCPSGALKARMLDGSAAAAASPDANVVSVFPNGPLYVHGQISIAGEPAGARLALCRCGASKAKPYCDGSHAKVDFKDPGPVACDPKDADLAPGPLNITPVADGPLVLEGSMSLLAASGREAFRGHRVALCRCGASKNKPFCDGSHEEAEFKAE